MILTDERATNCVKAALLWMRSHNVKWLKTEEKIYSRKHDYAGTMDGLAYVDSCTDPACCSEKYTHRLCLIDWKSSNQLKTEYCFQTAAYQQALQEEHNSPIESRWVLRLGKSEEEAGKFEPWFLSNADFVTDLDAFLACLALTRLVDSVEERMSSQKKTIRAVKKEQRETAKALKKEQEKLQKALDKAAAKIAKEAEKLRIKAEAKAERERLKAAKKGQACTSTSQEITEKKATTPLDSLLPAQTSLSANLSIQIQETPQPESIISTEVLVLSPEAARIVVKALANPPEPNEALKAAFKRYETEVFVPPFKLPMEG